MAYWALEAFTFTKPPQKELAMARTDVRWRQCLQRKHGVSAPQRYVALTTFRGAEALRSVERSRFREKA